MTNHRPRCASTISRKLNDPANNTTPINDRPMNTSYPSICAADRRPPSSAYLLFDAHPASTTLYAPIDDIASTKSTPMFRSATTTFGAKGTTTKDINTVMTRTPGAMTKIGLSANGGIQSSLKNNLITSATGWSNPNGPTRFGP